MNDRLQQAPVEFGPSQQWFSVSEAAAMMSCSLRHAARELAGVSPALIRHERQTGGRPRATYHFSAHPTLFAHFNRSGALAPEAEAPAAEGARSASEQQRPAAAGPVGPGPEELARAQLRAQAVEEYLARAHTMPELSAALGTVADWAAAPRRREVAWDERLEANRIRRHETAVEVGGFSLRTLRGWASLYKEGNRDLLVLADGRRGACGRKATEIPEHWLDIVHALAVSTARADVRLAIARANDIWPSEPPAISYDTVRRRLLARDPEKYCATLGKRGLGEFAMRHVPDCNRDYSSLRYNQLWQLDDITEDFYGHGSDPRQVLRPYAYAVIRVSTRQMICAVSCETPITQDQVRSLIGLAMADAAGGVPEEITFERGAVACDEYLAELLTTLGVTVHRTMMDGGRVHEGMLPDRAKGRFRGKAVIESNIRRHHRMNWDQPSQVGPEERHTAQARLESLKRYAARCIDKGLPPVLPTVTEWQALIHQALERSNTTAHTGLAKLVDPETGAARHMSPNQRAVAMAEQAVRVMPATMLPLFFERGLQVPVTKNGIRINGGVYGKFDEQLQQHAGRSVLAFALAEAPGVAYIKELGRCVELYVAPQYGTEDGQLQKAGRIGAAKKNQYRALIDRALEAGTAVNVDTVKFTSNPVPERTRLELDNPVLAARAAAMGAAQERHCEQRRTADARFQPGTDTADHRDPAHTPDASSPARRGGLLRNAAELREHLVALGLHDEPQEQT